MEASTSIQGGIKMSHLMVAKDIIIFAEASADQINCIKDGLIKFRRASGQSINLNRTLIYFSPNLNKSLIYFHQTCLKRLPQA